MKHFSFLSALTAAAVLLGGQAFAASKEEWKRCAADDADTSIRACTQLINRGKAETTINRARFFANRAIAYKDKGELDKALPDYDVAVALDPNFANGFIGRGNFHKEQGNLDKALSDYTRAIALDPKVASAFNGRGNTYSDQGELDRALSDYNQAIALDPKFFYAYNGRGNVWKDKNQIDRAIADYDKAIALNPKYALAYNGRANALKDSGQADRALADYSQAITLDPKYPYPYNGRGNIYKERGELDLALADYDRAITLNSRSALPYNGRGNVYKERGQLDLALADYEMAIKLDPQLSYGYNGRGNVYSDRGDNARAFVDYEKAIALNPTFPSPYNGRGNVYKERGELDRALADYDRAIALEPNEPIFYNQRGDAWQAKGDLTRAVADFDKVISMSPPWVQAIRTKREAALKVAASRSAERGGASPTGRQEDRTPTASPAAAARRVAFVIGNEKYQKITSLQNAALDAKSIADKLRSKGFIVTLQTDVGRTDFLVAFDRFKEQLRESDEVVVYYAGHGVEVNGANFLVPVDVPAFAPSAKQLIQDSSISLTSLLVQISARAPRATVVILDACRNDPFPQDMTVASNTRSAGVSKDGLGQVAAPEGMMVMYSAGVNQTALDKLGASDPSQNGLFTRNLLRLMDEKGLEISGMAKRLRAEVQVAARTVIDGETGKPHAQTPAVYDQMVGEFFFSPAE